MNGDKRDFNLDRILVEEVGQWGWFQLKAIVICGLVSFMSGMVCYLYLFTVAKVNTRCLIPECENSSAAFTPPWLQLAVPTSGNSFDNCHRYPTTLTTKSTNITENTFGFCAVNLFDRNSTVECEDYVYEHKNSAYYEASFSISIFWGRRFATILSAFNLAWIGALTYFAGTYTSYIVTCFIQCLFGVCSFACAYIMAIEFVGPKYRVITGASMSTYLALGMTALGLIASTEPYWRHLILIIYIPQFITVTFFWIAPESIRWLLSKGRYEEALVVLKTAAEMNGSALSEKTVEEFMNTKVAPKVKDFKEFKEPWLVGLVFKHKPILIRCIITPIWWLSCTLAYYGLTVSSVGISGNKYINYTASVAVEVPGYWIAVLLLDRIGRKALLMIKFLISGACQFAFIFLSKEHYWLSLSVYLIGKMCIAGVMTSLYVYTSELYPTRYRVSLLAFSSMIGRVGAIIAPLMPGLAAKVWVQLPFLLFGVLALASALLVLLAPETLGAALPDSMEEAAALGRGEKSSDSSVMRSLRKLMFRSKTYTLP